MERLLYLCYVHLRQKTEEFDEDKHGPRTKTAYRFHEIIFDLLVLFYSLELSEWDMTEFATATTVLSCLDVVVNCAILGRNFYDVWTNDRTERRFLCFKCTPSDCATAGVLGVTFWPCFFYVYFAV